MARDIHHIFPNGHGGWCVRRDGDTTALVNTDTKIRAIKIGIELSTQRDALVVIHDRERRSFRLGSTPAEIPFPFPFSDREAAQAGAEAPPGPRKRRQAARTTAAESYLTFDFDNGARP